MKAQNLHKNDFYGWCLQQANALEKGLKVDQKNLIEEILGLGRSERCELENRMEELFMHLLKCIYQPDYKTNSWIYSIEDQRDRIALLIKRNPSLKACLEESSGSSYGFARKSAAKETKLPLKTFPEQMPFTLEQALNQDWLP
jgi:hypothetical protein